MKITDIMTSQVATVEPDTSLRDAAARMADLRLGALPVHDGVALLGMITDRDIVCRSVARGLDPTRTAVREAMTPHVICCLESDPLAHVAALMQGKMIRRVVVLDEEGSLAGIVSLADLARRGGQEALAYGVLRDVTEPTSDSSTLAGREAPSSHATAPGRGRERSVHGHA
jgi:CBS domain-containing protein